MNISLENFYNETNSSRFSTSDTVMSLKTTQKENRDSINVERFARK